MTPPARATDLVVPLRAPRGSAPEFCRASRGLFPGPRLTSCVVSAKRLRLLHGHHTRSRQTRVQARQRFSAARPTGLLLALE